MRYDFAIFVEHDQSWKLDDRELGFESLDSLLLLERHGVPWHSLEISFEVVLLSVVTDEDDLDGAGLFVDFIINLGLEVLREESAWWSPVRTEVQANEFGGGHVAIECVEVDLIDFVAIDFQEGVSEELTECLVISLHFLLL